MVFENSAKHEESTDQAAFLAPYHQLLLIHCPVHVIRFNLFVTEFDDPNFVLSKCRLITGKYFIRLD